MALPNGNAKQIFRTSFLVAQIINTVEATVSTTAADLGSCSLKSTEKKLGFEVQRNGKPG